MDLDLYPHQEEALRKLSNGKILHGGVGSGKSRVAVAYYMKNEAPKDVIILTTAKKRESHDWQEEFYRAGIGPATGPDKGTPWPGQAGVYPYCLTVDSWNRIGKYTDVSGAFVVLDEQRLVGSGEWTKSFYKIAKKNNWILLSATPGDTWCDFIPVFVANNFYKNRTEFKREHIVYSSFTKFPKVDRFINVGRLARHRSNILVEMQSVRHTRRRHVEVPLRYDKETLDLVLKKRWHVYEDRPLRDVGEMCMVMRRVVNSDPSRLAMVKELWQIHPKLIVFYNYNFELESLRTLTSFDPQRASTKLQSSIISSGMDLRGISFDEKGDKSCLMKCCLDTSPTTSIDRSSDGSRRIPEETLAKLSKKCSTTNQPSIDGQRQTSSCGKDLSGPSTENLKNAGINSAAKNGVAMDRDTISMAEWNDDSCSMKCCPDTSSIPTTTPTASVSNGSRASLLEKKSKHSTIGDSKDGLLPRSEKPLSATSKKQLTSSSDTSDSMISEWNGHKHQPIPSTSRWLYLVQYTAGAEGWNCTETDAMIMYSRNYSWKVCEQAKGRIDRLNTPFEDLWYYDFTSDSMIDKAIGRALKAKQTFNEARFSGLFKG